MIHVSFKMFIDKPHVMGRISAKQRRVLAKAGGYARTAMKRQIRPPKRGKKARTVVVDGRPYFVPVAGMVIDVGTGRKATTEQAKLAREAIAGRLKGEGAGKPPRRGPSDLLRKHIYFGLEEHGETVVIGPMKFGSQPRLVGASSVPELLEKGGGEYIGNKLVKYDPHPFAKPTLPLATKKFHELIEKEPL